MARTFARCQLRAPSFPQRISSDTKRTPLRISSHLYRYGAGKTLQERKVIMGRKYIDCRDFPGDVKCTVAISADNEKELLEAVVEHGTKVHGYQDTPDFRNTIRGGMKEGNPKN